MEDFEKKKNRHPCCLCRCWGAVAKFQLESRKNGRVCMTRLNHSAPLGWPSLKQNSHFFSVCPCHPVLLLFRARDRRRRPAKTQLTQEFVEVMGGVGSTSFEKYRSLCVMTFLQARRSRDTIITLVRHPSFMCVCACLVFSLALRMWRPRDKTSISARTERHPFFFFFVCGIRHGRSGGGGRARKCSLSF